MSASPSYETEFLRRRARGLITGLHARLDELLAHDFPTKTPLNVIKLLRRVCEKVKSKIQNADDKQLSLINRLARLLQELLIDLDHAHTEQTPRGLVQILEWLLIEQKLSPDAHLLASPQSVYNYSIWDIRPRIEPLIKRLLTPEEHAELFGTFKAKIHSISFPRIERDNILLHAVFGHEVGHLIADRFLEFEAKQSSYNTEFGKFFDEVKITSEKLGRPLKDITALARVEEEFRTIRTRGMQELLSDYVGILLFGPSSQFASYEIFSLFNLDELPTPDDYYPPGRYRLRFGQQALKNEMFTHAIAQLAKKAAGENYEIFGSAQSFLAHIDNLASKDDDLKAIKGAPFVKIAYQWIESSMGSAISFAKRELAHVIYNAGRMKEQVPDLVERLSLKLPPNEQGVFPDVMTVDWRSSIVAGWFMHIYGKRLTKRGLEHFSPEDYTNVNSLTLQAVEYVTLAEKYAKFPS